MNKLNVIALALSIVISTSASGSNDGFINAARNEDVDQIRVLIKDGVNVNEQQPDGATALHWAVQHDNMDLLDMLIKAKADVNLADEGGATPLWVATYNANPVMVQRLLQAGADPNIALARGETPLMTAASIGDIEIVNALLSARADVNVAESQRKQTALMWAIAEGHADIVSSLIDHGADLRARSKGGYTPLLFASLNGKIESAKILVSMDVDINEISSDKSSPLLIAAAAGHDKLTQYLLEQGADPHAIDYKGFTALHYAAMKRNMTGSVVALLAKGADANARIVRIGADNELHPVSDLPFLKSATRIIDVDTRGGTYPVGATPLYLAAQQRNTDAIRLLSKSGADHNLRTSETVFFLGGSGRRVNYIAGSTPLMTAAGMDRVIDNWNGYPEELEMQALEAVKAAVELGGDINATNEYGMTALHAASFIGADSIVEFLIKNGANPDAKDLFGQTPLSIAEQVITAGLGENFDVRPRRSNPELVSLLLNLGAIPLEKTEIVERPRQ